MTFLQNYGGPMVRENEGCTFGQVTRTMLDSHCKESTRFKIDIKKEFEELRETNTQLYNHLSSRLPPWATTIGALGMLIIGAFIGGYI